MTDEEQQLHRWRRLSTVQCAAFAIHIQDIRVDNEGGTLRVIGVSD